jgi:hypothetical protein
MYGDGAGSNVYSAQLLTLKNGDVNYASGVGPVSGGRVRDVTHGKQKGVKYIIKVL